MLSLVPASNSQLLVVYSPASIQQILGLLNYEMYISSVLLVSIVALGVTCIPWGGPKETPVRREGDGVGWSPVPTPEPRSFFDSIALWKRQGYSLITTTGTTYSSYSYATCGFLSGSTSRYGCSQISGRC